MPGARCDRRSPIGPATDSLTDVEKNPVGGVGSGVVALYDQLVRLDPSQIIALNRAIAVAELEGPEVALAANTAEIAYLTRRRDQPG